MRAHFILSLALLLLLLSVDGAQAQQWSEPKTLVVDIKAKLGPVPKAFCQGL